MLRDVVLRTLFSLACGAATGLIVWWIILKRRRALRALDLLSYALTVIALGSGLFAVRHYEERWQAALTRLDVNESIVDSTFDDVVDLSKVCPGVPDTPTGPSQLKIDECARLTEYFDHQQYGSRGHWVPAAPPDVSSFTISTLHHYAARLADHVNASNRTIAAYDAKMGLDFPDYFEGRFLMMAIPILAFALGIGVSRRAIDLYNDWAG
jgi:hypothetical protein